MKNMNTTYADRVSLYVPGDTQLYIPKEERERREQERQEKYKQIQDEALELHKQMYEERTSPDWEIKPLGTYVIIKPYIDSPYLSPTTASGLIIKRDLKHNSRSGEDEMQVREIAVGKVIDCGKECKEIKPGMDAMFMAGGARVLPISTNEYGEEEFVLLPEGHIVVYGYSLKSLNNVGD